MSGACLFVDILLWAICSDAVGGVRESGAAGAEPDTRYSDCRAQIGAGTARWADVQLHRWDYYTEGQPQPLSATGQDVILCYI